MGATTPVASSSTDAQKPTGGSVRATEAPWRMTDENRRRSPVGGGGSSTRRVVHRLPLAARALEQADRRRKSVGQAEGRGTG
jgi:hypothetical protein